jgi:hypothetical protein
MQDGSNEIGDPYNINNSDNFDVYVDDYIWSTWLSKLTIYKLFCFDIMMSTFMTLVRFMFDEDWKCRWLYDLHD